MSIIHIHDTGKYKIVLFCNADQEVVGINSYTDKVKLTPNKKMWKFVEKELDRDDLSFFYDSNDFMDISFPCIEESVCKFNFLYN